MKPLKFIYKNSSRISQTKIKQISQPLKKEAKILKEVIKNFDINNERAFVTSPKNKSLLKKTKILIKSKRKFNPKYIVVIGIGGSNLGTIAVQEAILGKLYNQLNPKIKVLYVDTTDPDSLWRVIKIIEPSLKKKNNVIINGISKSGGTTETIANLQIFVNLIKRYKKNYQDYIVITTDKNSKLWDFALKKSFDVLEIPKNIGGRYSVFTPVGLFPLGILGINLDKLLKGAENMNNICTNINVEKNPAMIEASLLYAHLKNKKNINDHFLFSKDLESSGKWFRQLMGESIGKQYNLNKKLVYAGITPTVSIGSTDLHSMAQLYLGGPYDKFTTFVSLEKNNFKIKVPKLDGYEKLVSGIQTKYLARIMDAILKGTQTAFKKGRRPFSHVILPDKSECSIGQYLQLKMFEIVYLARLLNLNPFNQPNVENYKLETKKLLK